jgi:hypothetical protein
MDKEEPKPQKRKKAVKQIDTTASISASSLSSDQIRKLLKEVMLDGMYESKKRSDLEVDAIIATMEEFLRSFIIIGYNMKNEPLVITNAKSQLDADGLYTSLTRLFLSIHNNGGM